MADNSVDAVVTDPPYGLSKQPDMREVLTHWLAGDDYSGGGGGFMGKTWDSFVPGPRLWSEIYRVLKPGGHVVAFFGSRTYDLGVTAMRLAGFEVRDALQWIYGSGFPKSMNLGDGWGTALKPAFEPIVLARKPLIGTVAANVLEYGTGGLNIDECRIAHASDADRESATPQGKVIRNNFAPGERRAGTETSRPDTSLGRFPANVLLDEEAAAILDEQAGPRTSGAKSSTHTRAPRAGATSLAMDPNLSYDLPSSTGGPSRFFYVAKASRKERDRGCESLPVRSGGEATDREDGSDGLNSPRAGAGRGGGVRNPHPTVKPVDLMRWLCRLITPPGGLILDPFCGSGSTGVAALAEGFEFLGVEMTDDYLPIIEARIRHALGEQK